MPSGHPRVVIIGAGFGGLEAAKALKRAAAEVTVIDRQNHHCFQPLLYQVATAALSPADIAWPIRHILRPQRNATVLMEDVRAIDTDKKCLRTQFGVVPYDYLVIATGAMHSYFGHDDWSNYAPGLKRIEDATRIRRSILIAFEQAEVIQDPDEQRRLLTFVIVGGGATGVEMAGAIADVARETLAADFRRIDPRSARIVLIEAGPRLLPAFPKSLSDYARDTLSRAGVEVRIDTLVTKCDPRGVDLKDGRIDASTVILAAGVMASPAARWLNVEADRAGRIKVRPDLSVPDHPEIFVVGDAAAVFDAKGRPVPGIAPAAKQMGKYVGKLVSARIAGRGTPKPFHYVHLGDLATIGRRAAVVKFGRLELRGFLGWVFWSLAHIYFLIGLRNRFVRGFQLVLGLHHVSARCTPDHGRVHQRKQIREPAVNSPCKILAAAFVAASLFGPAATSHAVELDPKVLTFKLPDQINWGPVTPAGNQQAVLFGDPAKPGPYGVMVKWLAGNHFSRPHVHPNDRFITVLSGTWWVGSGPDFDPDKASVAMPAGSFVTHHGRQVHWDGAKDTDAVLLIVGDGPATSTPFGTPPTTR